MKKCTNCGKELNDNAAFCDACGANQNAAPRVPQHSQTMPTSKQQPKKKKNGCLIAVIIVIALLLLFACAMCAAPSKTPPTNTDTVTNQSQQEQTSVDTDTNQTENKQAAEDNQNSLNTTTGQENVPSEYKAALRSAKTYSDMMNMSKKGIYDQLTSEYGGKFTAEAAQYAIDNLDADYKLNALKSAETYQEMMNMSKAAIYDQLVSEYGGQFTAEEADYAIANLE